MQLSTHFMTGLPQISTFLLYRVIPDVVPGFEPVIDDVHHPYELIAHALYIKFFPPIETTGFRNRVVFIQQIHVSVYNVV